MRDLNVSECLFVFSLCSIWSLLLINIILAMGGYIFYFKNFDKEIKKLMNILWYQYLFLLIMKLK